MGKVVGIASHSEKRGPMVVYAGANVTFRHGVGDDFRGKRQGNRQVTVMTLESWNAVCKELDRKLHWTMRRANILIEGIDLENSTGKVLRIGPFLLEVTGECDPCFRMDEQFSGLTKALTPHWRGGVTCKILSEGEIKEGDFVELISR